MIRPNRKLMRRGASAWACVALLASACGPAGTKAVKPAPPQPVFPETPVLNLLTWPNYFDATLLEEFTAATGIAVACASIGNSAQITQFLASDPRAHDLVVADDKTCMDLAKLGLLETLDHRQLKGLSNLAPSFLDLDFDPGNRYSVPFSWGTLALVWRSDLSPAPAPSWGSLWVESIPGRLDLPDEPDDLLFLTLLADGRDPNRATAAEVGAARDRLLRLAARRNLRLGSVEDGLDAITTGSSALLVTYSGDAVELAMQDERVRVAIPSEGAPLWLDSFVIRRDSPRAGDAHRFIDFFLRPEIAARNANAKTIATPVQAARALLRPQLLAQETLFPRPELLAKCRFIRFEVETRRAVTGATGDLYRAIREGSPQPRAEALAPATPSRENHP
jgi:spermidine/putrescine-binding protein